MFFKLPHSLRYKDWNCFTIILNVWPDPPSNSAYKCLPEMNSGATQLFVLNGAKLSDQNNQAASKEIPKWTLSKRVDRLLDWLVRVRLDFRLAAIGRHIPSSYVAHVNYYDLNLNAKWLSLVSVLFFVVSYLYKR